MTGGWQFAFGDIRHKRIRPAKNAFTYPAFFLRVPVHALIENSLDASNLPGVSKYLFGINRTSALSFHEKDHGDGRGCWPWVCNLLHDAGLQKPTSVWLHCFSRVLGYTFKPVSFWFCHDAQDKLTAIVAEVNNTFGERHVYLLSGNPRFGKTLSADKVFHVSPFCDTQGEYSFRFMTAQDRTVAVVDHHDAQGPLLQTSMSGRLGPVSNQSAINALMKFPLFTWGVVFKIHWQAIRLWIKKVPFFSKPAPPSQLISHHTS
jgi:uncharacterized protein